MKTIPQLREEMRMQAAAYRKLGFSDLAEMIDGWVAGLYRRKPVRQAQPGRWGATPEPAAIAEYAERKPQASYMEIATEMGCSIGRVSEALAGRREAA